MITYTQILKFAIGKSIFIFFFILTLFLNTDFIHIECILINIFA